jgi:hypothetical protein
MGHPPEHGELAVEELEGPGDITVLDITPGDGHAKRGADLGRAPGGDPPVVSAIRAGSPLTLGDVESDGAGGPPDLEREVALPAPDERHRTPERPHEIKTDFESIEHCL